MKKERSEGNGINLEKKVTRERKRRKKTNEINELSKKKFDEAEQERKNLFNIFLHDKISVSNFTFLFFLFAYFCFQTVWFGLVLEKIMVWIHLKGSNPKLGLGQDHFSLLQIFKRRQINTKKNRCTKTLSKTGRVAQNVTPQNK